MRWLDRMTNSMKMNLSKLLEVVEDRGTWQTTAQRVAHGFAAEQQQQM